MQEQWDQGILVGDGVAIMKCLDSSSVDLVVTSPPYDDLREYNGYTFDMEEMANGIFRVLKDGGVAVWIVGDRIYGGRTLSSFRQALAFQDIGFTAHDVMIYQKKNTPFMRSNAYTPAWEFMFVMSKGAPKTFNPLMCKTVRHGKETAVYGKGPDGDNSKRRAVKLKKEKVRTNIWAYAVGLGGTTRDRYAFKHPAMFPEALARDHILSWTHAGDMVLDPMCGAGTTCKMAKALDRKWMGIEISPEYADIARRRVREVEYEFS